MKKILSILLSALLFVSSLCGCGGTPAKDKTLHIVTTIFPEYDWVKNIVGENSDADLCFLLDNGVDLHNYQPTADDLITVSTCDIFIYVGGESDSWVKDALKNAVNKDMIVIDLMDVLGDHIKEEELAEGMQVTDEEEDKGEEPEYDEHVWLSLINAQILCREIANKLCEADAANAQFYTDNCNAYLEKLNALDGSYREAVASAETKTLLFGDRFPFRYLTDDYGLSYYAAFVGCSAETEASFETVAFLAAKIDELGLHSVITLEGSDGKIARTIIQNTKEKNQSVLSLDSLQGTNAEDAKSGTTYISIMKKNLSVLKQALGE